MTDPVDGEWIEKKAEELEAGDTCVFWSPDNDHLVVVVESINVGPDDTVVYWANGWSDVYPNRHTFSEVYPVSEGETPEGESQLHRDDLYPKEGDVIGRRGEDGSMVIETYHEDKIEGGHGEGYGTGLPN